MAKPRIEGTFDDEIFTYANGEQWQWKVLRNRFGVIIKSDWVQISQGSTSRLDDEIAPRQGFGNLVGVGTGDLSILPNGEIVAFGTLPGANTINTSLPPDFISESNPTRVIPSPDLLPVFQNFKLNVNIIKSPNRGKVFVNGIEDDFTFRVYDTRELLNNQYVFEIREGNKTSLFKYQIEVKSEVEFYAGMGVTKYEVSSYRLDEQGNRSLTRLYSNESNTATLNFDLSDWDTEDESVVLPYEIEIEIDGEGESNILSYVFGEQSGRLESDIYSNTQSGVFNINVINPQDINKYGFTYILYRNGNEINRSNNPYQTYTLTRGTFYTLSVITTKNTSSGVLTPTINVSSNSISFDLSSSSTSLTYSTLNTDRVLYFLGNVERTLPANGRVSLTPSDFSKVGQFTLYLQPISDEYGSGEPSKVIINVTNTKRFAGPDITHISYPQNIIGQDFKGYDVDFKISWSSINTDWVDVWVGKISDSTKLVSKRDPQGQLTLNVRNVLTKAGINTNDNIDFVNFKLLLVPYNASTNQQVQGKVEEISIRFDKGNLTLQRGKVVRDIREAIIRQFDKSILKTEDSKYLTHLLHLGEGNNKLISTWDIDRETFSRYEIVNEATGEERKVEEFKSLILKLYEPLPGDVTTNQQVWLSKIQSIPIIEQLTIIDEQVEDFITLQPNLNERFVDDIGLQIYDDLIASGSTTSTDIVNTFVSSSGFSLKDLDIQFVSSSKVIVESGTGAYLQESSQSLWYENFVKYSSAAERIENFFYKVKLIDFYNEKLNLVQTGSEYTNTIALSNEKVKLENQINQVKAGFDAFEDYLYTQTGSLTYPGAGQNEVSESTTQDALNWYSSTLFGAQEYDLYNNSRFVNNLPDNVKNSAEGQEFVLFFDMVGQHFDLLWVHIKSLQERTNIEHKQEVGIKDTFLYQMLESLGWDADLGLKSQALWNFAFGKDKDGTQVRIDSGKDRQNEVWRRILNNLPYLLKHKGTKRAIHALMSCYGVPASLLTVMEFGGPRDVTKNATTDFTYEDRTAAINISGSESIRIPWKTYNGNYPNSVEVRVKTELKETQQLISASNWSLDIIPNTGSLAVVKLTVGSVSSSTSPIPFYNDEYAQIVINRETGSIDTFIVYVKEGFQERIRNEATTTLTNNSSDWEGGSLIELGGSTLNGSIDEFRLWTSPLNESIIENHTLVPDAINGNHISASSEDLIFRNDFEYPKDRGTDTDIKNVAIIQSYATSSVAVGFTPISNYPYQYIPYDRTVTAKVPSTGINYSNKFRFENQFIENTDMVLTATSSIDLSYRQRSTKRSFDQAPIDSDRLGLFFSPIKEINMDILRSVGPINVDDFIGDPADNYNYTYRSLDNFREYYFQRYDLNFQEYIQLVRYIDKTLFDQLESLVPARAKVAKGLLFEPHILERSKTQWNRPSGTNDNYTASIDTQDDINLTSLNSTHLAIISASENTILNGDTPFYSGTINGSEITEIESETANFTGTYIATNDLAQSGVITRNSGSTMGGFEITINAQITGSVLGSYFQEQGYQQVGGFSPDSLEVGGFGVYGENSYSNRTRLDGNGNLVKDKVRIFRIKESYDVAVPNVSGSNNLIPYDEIVQRFRQKVVVLPQSSSNVPTVGGNIVEVEPLDGYFTTHYRFVNDLSTGLQNSYFNGSKQTESTTLDGGSPVQTFTTNPNTLRVTDTGRGSGEPILEVD